MMPVNLGDQLQVLTLIPSAAITADGNGTGVDTLEYAGEMAAFLNSAVGTGNADNRLDVKLQSSEDNSTSWTDITGAAFTQVDNATPSVQKVSFNKDEVKRYVRAVKDVTGTSPSFIAGCVLVGIKKYPA